MTNKSSTGTPVAFAKPLFLRIPPIRAFLNPGFLQRRLVSPRLEIVFDGELDVTERRSLANHPVHRHRLPESSPHVRHVVVARERLADRGCEVLVSRPDIPLHQ